MKKYRSGLSLYGRLYRAERHLSGEYEVPQRDLGHMQWPVAFHLFSDRYTTISYTEYTQHRVVSHFVSNRDSPPPPFSPLASAVILLLRVSTIFF